ncbi:MAG: hypothetical protein J5552_06255 [Prevotella sp.]|nr:hypothetical protein [Prevotella sp.]
MKKEQNTIKKKQMSRGRNDSPVQTTVKTFTAMLRPMQNLDDNCGQKFGCVPKKM